MIAFFHGTLITTRQPKSKMLAVTPAPLHGG